MLVRTPRLRGAFTLIEMLVALGVAAVLALFFLPAIQNSRENARRVQCANNLMQLSVAIENYESVHEVLPPGVVNETGPIRNLPFGYHVSWLVQILPYLDQKNTYRHLDHRASIYSVNNSTARAVVIHSLHCPSDPGAGPASNPPSSYAACYDDSEVPVSRTNSGVFFLNSSITFDDITDGRQQTIFLGEKLLTVGELGWASGTRATLRNTGTRLSRVRPSLTTEIPPDFDASEPELVPVVDPFGGFGSFHSGGTNIAFGDGSVRFIKNEIDIRILRRLANREDGEMVSDNEF